MEKLDIVWVVGVGFQSTVPNYVVSPNARGNKKDYRMKYDEKTAAYLTYYIYIITFVACCIMLLGCVFTIPKVTIDTTPSKTNSTAWCNCDLSKPLSEGPYDDAYMAAHEYREECASEYETGLFVRYQVKVKDGAASRYYLQSSIGIGHFKLLENNLVSDCFVLERNGKSYRYHVAGFGRDELRTGEEPRNEVTGNSAPYDGQRWYINVECREP